LLWENAALRPDELKIYPCQLLENAELYEYWRRGEYQPYTTEELIELISDLKPKIPRYCRVNRIVRDIPSPNVVAGNKRTSLRQDIQRELKRRGLRCECIRCREVRGTKIAPERLEFGDLVYETRGSEEHFLSYSTRTDKIAGYVRLSLPNGSAPKLGFPELEGSALIRELHVYGPSVPFGEEREGAAQHVGLGQDLMERAEGVARDRGFRRMAVISALGTRGYYRKLGYELGNTYMIKGF
jgi:elongator complex protein 3